MADYSGDGGGRECWRVCLRTIWLLISSGLLTSALAIWLLFRTSDPVCSIEDIYVPQLNKSEKNSTYSKIYFDLKLDNQNKDKGIYYDALNLTFYYPPNLTSPIGSFNFPGFYQGYEKKARRKDWVEVGGVRWAEARKAVRNGSTVFRVDLATAVRFKVVGCKTKKHKLVVGSDIWVDDLGNKVGKKGVELKSGGYRFGLERLVVLFSVLVLMLFI